MIVYYRMTPHHSYHESKRPIYAYDKLSLSALCLKSFVEGFADSKPTIVFLLDGCDAQWDAMIKGIVPFKHTINHVTFNDQQQSYLHQLKLAKAVNDFVLFQEDDYLYLPRISNKLLHAMKELGFVNPYDHREFYTNQDHFGSKEVRLIKDHHWQAVRFNTMTWGAHSSLITEHWETLNKHGYWDQLTWDAMREEGVNLWSPIPALATHMHTEFLAPSVNWLERIKDVDQQY